MPPAENQQSVPRRPRIYYGLWMVALAGVVVAVATVPFQDALAVWAVALEQQFDWSRSELSIGLTISRLLGLTAPVAGYFSDRFGPRRMVLSGLCLTFTGFVLFGLIWNLPAYYFAFVILGVGAQLSGTIPLVVLLSRWFMRRRATAIAISLMVAPVAALVLVPLIAWGTGDGWPGWRQTAFAVAGVILLVAALAFSRMRNEPQDIDQLRYGNPAPQESQTVNFSMGQAFRSRAFWLIAIADALASASATVILAYLGLMMSDRGHSLAATALVIPTYTVAATIFYLVGGLAGDRLPKRTVMALFVALQAVGMALLPFAGSLPVYFLATVIMGMGTGGRTPLVLAILPDYFGIPFLGRILGFQFLFASIISIPVALIPVGVLLDVTGNYILALVPMQCAALVSAYLYLKARPPQLPAPPGPLPEPPQG